MQQEVRLQLANGEHFTGQLIGAPMNASGELVFTTGMVGYSEALTDPSYFGQILVFAYPLIGNYGVPIMPSNFSLESSRGFESNKVHASAVIVASDSQDAYHWTSHQPLNDWLKAQGVPGISGIDTRHLVHLIRDSKNLLAKVLPTNAKEERQLGSITPKADEFFDPGTCQIIQEVSTHERKILGKGRTRIGLIDLGVKWNIIRQLIQFGCEVELLPWDTDPMTVDCSGWVLSNGPGNPNKTGSVIHSVESLFEQERPILGICLGHQILCSAAGFKTSRMSFGHRSHNQPVYMVGSKKAYITSQNHGYVVTEDEKTMREWDIWFRNVNDHSIEGIRHKYKPFKSVQFHPESAGGPRDTAWILQQFVTEVVKSC